MDEIDVADNLSTVRRRIIDAEQCFGRTKGSVNLLAVSKTKPEAMIREAYAAGQRAFGENYVQEGVEKAIALSDLDIDWHFIGPLQSNKTRVVAEHFAWVHSIDREKIARRLGEQRPGHLPDINVCLQVNISGEASKSGVSTDEVPALARAVAALPGLQLRGLMAIPAPSKDPAAQRLPFAALRALLSELQSEHPSMDTLSMGMSGDLEAAVAEGATIVRIGTDIFGARAPA
jgi:pyridoxal phosphate enzyme (YggS family)